MRFGSSQMTIPPHPTPALRLQALCLSAAHAQHGVVRLPHTHITPLDDTANQVMAHIITHHQLRVIIHAPIAPPRMIRSELIRYGQFLRDIAASDGVIICHLPSDDAHEWASIATLSSCTDTTIAVEMTTQSIDRLCAASWQYQIPIIFDWLHYHVQAPWPYTPLDAATMCMSTWGQHRPLIHLSSLDTAHHGTTHRHAHGRHSDYVDWVTHMYFVGMLATRVTTDFDIEIEASAGAAAVAHFLVQCRRHTPHEWQSLWH